MKVANPTRKRAAPCATRSAANWRTSLASSSTRRGSGRFRGRGIGAPFAPASVIEPVAACSPQQGGEDQGIGGNSRSASRDERLHWVDARVREELPDFVCGLEGAVLAVKSA